MLHIICSTSYSIYTRIRYYYRQLLLLNVNTNVCRHRITYGKTKKNLNRVKGRRKKSILIINTVFLCFAIFAYINYKNHRTAKG